MRIERIENGWSRPRQSADVEESVRGILDDVAAGGDAAVLELTERFDHAELGPEQLRVDAHELEPSVGVLEPAVLAGLRTAIDNVRAVAREQLREPAAVDLPQGHRVEIAETPVRRAAIYVPGGEAPYPSTVVMGAVTARAAGVDEIVVCAPPGPGGRAHPVILAACVLCEVHEVYRMGGAQAIAALAYGTESVRRVDVIAGPGNPYVQEAKRQVAWTHVGIDGIAGPSELAVLTAGDGVEPELIALDLLAQSEHGENSPLWLLSPDGELLDAVVDALERLDAERASAHNADLQVISARSLGDALTIVEAIAPEHLELVGDEAEALADRVRFAGCVFVGRGGATAFGDYVAGSNHVLPTGGAARFQSALSPATFRRRMARVSLPGEAPARLAPAGAALARAEGFPVHAESMERRA
jgi:histidinol dehydrogenase